MKTSQKINDDYPQITKLKIPIRENGGTPYIFGNDLDKVLTAVQRKQFNAFFGIQTCMVVDGKTGLYPWDVEAVLARMFTGKLQGTQLFWD